MSIAYSRGCFEPVFASPFRIERLYVSEVVRRIQDVKRVVFARDKSFVPLPPGMAFINRLQFGFYSVLARLDVEVDYASIDRKILQERPAGRD